MYRYTLIKSAKGYEIYVNLIASAAGLYLNRQPHLLSLIKEIMEAEKLKGAEVTIEHNMGRIIGNTDIVTTSDQDTIFYAQPYKKKVFSRYVKNRSLSPSHSLTILLRQDEAGDYELYDTWIGPYSPPFPGDDRETTNSRLYWQNHALVIDMQAIQSKTLTKVCPY